MPLSSWEFKYNIFFNLIVRSSSPDIELVSMTDGLIMLGGAGIIDVIRSVNSFLNGFIANNI